MLSFRCWQKTQKAESAMPKPELEFFPVDNVPWVPVPGAPPGHYQKILTEDPDKMFVTRMLKVDRLHRLMDAGGLDAVAVRTGVNFTYLAGIALPGTLARHLDIASTVRGFMLIWPRKGEPIIVLDSFAETLVARDSWVGKIVVYKAYVESLYPRVAHVLHAIGLAN